MLSFNGIVQAQSNYLDKILYEDSLTAISHVYKECRVKDSAALILLIIESSRWTKGEYADYVIFYPNNKIEIIQAFTPNDSSKKSKWKKTRVSQEANYLFWNFLDSCISNDLFSLNQEELFRNTKPTADGRVSSLGVADGTFYSFAIFKGRHYLNNSAYSPQSFISAEYPGLEERKKFLAVIQGFRKLITRSVKKSL